MTYQPAMKQMVALSRRLNGPRFAADEPTKPSVVLELRPALDGFAGIPQETRLLFKCLKGLGQFQTHGLLQHSSRVLFRSGHKERKIWRRAFKTAARIHNYSRFVVSF